jgi:hypothetical protein
VDHIGHERPRTAVAWDLLRSGVPQALTAPCVAF